MEHNTHSHTSLTDHIGGHITGSQHIPSRTLDHAIPSLVHKLKNKDTVIFHCALSQQRGPFAALHYLRARERLLGSGVGEAMKRTKGESLQTEEEEEEEEEEEKDVKGEKEKEEEGEEKGEWEDMPTEEGEGEERVVQRVLLLEDGFVGWQERYGNDERLTTGYIRELWKEGGGGL